MYKKNVCTFFSPKRDSSTCSGGEINGSGDGEKGGLNRMGVGDGFLGGGMVGQSVAAGYGNGSTHPYCQKGV